MDSTTVELTTQAPKEPKSKFTATQALLETVTDRPDIFLNRSWKISDLRDKLLHPYDLLRLEQTYGDLAGISQALALAVQSSTWITTTSTSGNLDTMFITRKIPTTNRPDSLPAAYDMIDGYSATMRRWKDAMLTLNDVLMTARSMKMSVEDAAEKLNTVLALCVLYREDARKYYDTLREAGQVKGSYKEPKQQDVLDVLEDPKKHIMVSELANLHGFLQE